MSADSIINDAMAAVRTGQHDQAVNLCKRVLKENPDHVGGLQVLAFAEHHRRNDNEAVKWLRKAVELRPADPALRYNLGVLLQELGRMDEAALAYRRALELKRDNLGAWNNLGVVLRQSGRLDESIESLQKALELNPNSAKTLSNLASTQLDAGLFDEAEATCRQALQFSPNLVAAHTILGVILKEAERTDEAIASYRQALQLEPQHTEANMYLANLLSNEGQYGEAISLYKRALERNPNHTQCLSNLAVAYNRAGKIEEALKVANQACQVEPENPLWHYNVAALLSKDRDPRRLRQAHQHLEDLLHLDPQHAAAHQILAIVQSKLGDIDGAIQMASRGVKLDPEDVSIWVTLGDLQASDGRFDEAIESLEQAVTLAPDRSQPNRQLGIAYLRAHKIEKAESALRTAYDLDDNDQRTIAHLGLALAGQGKHEEAEQLQGMQRFVTTVMLQPVAPYDSIEALNDALEKDIRNHPTLKYEPVGLAARKAHLTGELMDAPTPAIKAFDQMLREAIDRYAENLDTTRPHPFITHRPAKYKINLWATLSEGAGYVDSHIHEESWLSGAYYVRVPSNVGDDETNPAGWFEFGTPSDPLLTEIDAPVQKVRPLEGMQVLFPSYLFHRTLPHDNEEGRISIAFDLEPLD